MRSARENNNLIDVRGGRGLRSLILLDNDGVVASSIHPITLFKRIEDGEKVYIKSMASIKETMKKAYITRAKEDGIVIVDKDDYEQLEKDLTSKENRVQRMNDLKGFKK
jgi:PHD/YefM family antitoxin component YafN of YafNO toxin-antitoxin module